jgi:hypothetical protein
VREARWRIMVRVARRTRCTTTTTSSSWAPIVSQLPLEGMPSGGEAHAHATARQVVVTNQRSSHPHTHASFNVPNTPFAIILCSSVVVVVFSCNSPSVHQLPCPRPHPYRNPDRNPDRNPPTTHLIRMNLANNLHVPQLDLFIRNEIRHSQLLDS